MREWMMALMTKSAINTPQTGTSTVVFGIPPRMAFGTLPPDGVIVAYFHGMRLADEEASVFWNTNHLFYEAMQDTNIPRTRVELCCLR